MGTLLLYLTTVIIWGTTWFAITFQLGVVPVEWSLVYRFGLAAILLLAFCKITGRNLTFPRKSHLIFFGLGFFLFGANYYFSYLGVENITSGLVAVTFSVLTFLNMINAAIFLKRPMTSKNISGALIGLSGIGLIFWPELRAVDLMGAAGSNGVLLGIGFTLLATYLASLGNTLANITRNQKVPVLQTNAWGMAYGTLLLAGFAIFSGKPMVFDTSAPFVWSLLYLTIFGTIVAFTAFLVLVGRLGMERAGYFSVMFPIVALTISTFYEGYTWTLQAAFGVGLTILGNIIVLRKSRSEGLPSPTNQQVEAAKI